MERKIRGVFVMAVLVASLFVASSMFQIRPMNQMYHPGLTNPYVPPAEGPNHSGPSDYTSHTDDMPEICESDFQIRPANWQRWFLRAALCDEQSED